MLITITEHKSFIEVYITCREGAINSTCHGVEKIDFNSSKI